MELVNRTDWAAERLLSVDHMGAEVLVVIVKATWALPAAESGALHPADEQAPVVLAVPQDSADQVVAAALTGTLALRFI